MAVGEAADVGAAVTVRIDHRRHSDELTPHEVRIVGMIAEGLHNSEIATVLRRSKHTVDSQVKEILRKTGERNRVTLAVATVRNERED